MEQGIPGPSVDEICPQSSTSIVLAQSMRLSFREPKRLLFSNNNLLIFIDTLVV